MAQLHNRPQRLESISFERLKNLKDIDLKFGPNNITGIFGSNGCGKSTVLHALACIYKPIAENSRLNYKFSNFFLPTTLGTWTGSKFTATFSFIHGQNNLFQPEAKTYKKQGDRWTPKYDNRPAREVFYIGIKSCVPDMEMETRQSKLQLNQHAWDNPALILELKEHSSFVMNREYDEINLYLAGKKRYKSLKFSNIEYSSLYMGAGEQRILQILMIVLAAPDYSLILVDEIDLTLHTEALLRLMSTLNDIAELKKLQIVFTSHREELLNCSILNIRHLINDEADGYTKTCLERTTPECIRRITGAAPKTLEILVEDDLAEALIRQILREKKVEPFCTVTRYGSIENSFSVGAGLILRGESLDNTIIVTDGDRYRTIDSRRERIDKMITGKDAASLQHKNLLLSKIKQFSIAEGIKPEIFIVEAIKNLPENKSTLITSIKNVGVVKNHHDLLNIPIANSGMPKSTALDEIARLLSTCQEWNEYVRDISNWLDDRIAANNLK